LEFALPAGQFNSYVIARESLPTGFFEALSDNDFDASDVDLVGGLRARIVSLTGDDFSQIERIDLRACPLDTPGGCTNITYNLFSIRDNYRRNQQTVNLNPTPVNLRELFIGSDNFRFEIVVFPGETTSIPVDARLEWTIHAVGDLE
jgi:hypothetical protein